MAILMALVIMVFGLFIAVGTSSLPPDIEQQMPVPNAIISVLGLVLLGVGAVIIAAAACTLTYVLMRSARQLELH